MAARRTFWDAHFSVPLVRVNGVELPLRTVLNFITDLNPESPTVEDDEVDEETEIPLTGFLGTVPGGAVGSLQVHVLDGEQPRFGGAPVLVNDDGGLDFGADRQIKSGFTVEGTTNATETPLATITIPADLGDGIFVVHAEASYAYATAGVVSGGDFAKKASFKREDGELTRVAISNLTLSELETGTPAGGFDIDVGSDTTIEILGTGLASKNIEWTTSYHVRIAVAS